MYFNHFFAEPQKSTDFRGPQNIFLSDFIKNFDQCEVVIFHVVVLDLPALAAFGSCSRPFRYQPILPSKSRTSPSL
jgi:hypothetical protein